MARNAIPETSRRTAGLMHRAMTVDPMSTSRREVQARAVAEPSPTQKTCAGFAPASRSVVIWVLSPISERNTRPIVVKKRRQGRLLKESLMVFALPPSG